MKYLTSIAFIPSFLAASFMMQSCAASYEARNNVQKSPTKVEFKAKPVENYKAALNSDNNGLVESSIFQTLVYWKKTGNPDVKTLLADMQELQITGSTPAIQYQAFLASYILSHESMIEIIDPSLYNDSQEFFKDVGKFVNEEMLNPIVEATI